ncbi:beta-1 3-galactosyltransferase 1 [Biomphalaria glabrata]|uniref:Hexosyltransferase n=1 Tax=Biomphalaria glabrata TaxID=6526 RepID=A0A2C9JMU8_BIOGL|nr:beta-1,3-galactosyltransferase 1-like [Biomphalaria glabrata]XP_013073789.1 beta-1,3-galactosyltransferase 1-like [Biomphalaria glabrata]XP_055879946.1 beta-1,3-galactosyltransferase 1-like [Biomphalaria glabrata]XP_055879950.1 beta-1,3-galactosyltransferase 1-like [Biomphalaria glabrata]KAI8755704.1 beta-1; 3-galactosyltransferase 1-like [Biomphalaria glabrata]KAI8793233.1 beta-1,3-galactosyltransferase 1 [Biomphalaria glabrata]
MFGISLRKTRLTFIIGVILIVNIFCLLSISLQNVMTWRYSSSQLYLTAMSRDESIFNTTLNPAVQLKLQNMKNDLNDSKFTNGDMFPAHRIGGYIMIDPDLCRRSDVLDIIVVVHTAPANLARRQRIRDTFGNEANFLPFHVRVAFLLGRTENRTLERMLWFEHATYNDTVMGDFLDDYHNLSLKGVMGYRWASQYCVNSKFVLKIDDDVIINMYKLLYSFYSHMSGKRKSIFCNLWYKNTMPILRTGKWKVEPHVFSKHKTYPYDYCSGFVVIMTTDLMGPMYQAAMTTPFFWIDDVYLFGMLPNVVGGVTYYNYALDKNMTLKENLATECTKTQGPRCPIFASIVNDKNYTSLWNTIKEIYASSSWHVDNKLVT